MKILLIIVNLFLAGMVVREGFALLRPSGGETLELVRRERPATSGNSVQPAVTAKENVSVDPLRTVLRHNIFDMSRCPDAIAGRRGASGSSISLVGVYQIGDCVGAIIQQKRQNNRRGPWRNNRNSGNNSKQELPLQQFFRIGESLENGYRLEEVYPDRVVLRRNGGSMELRLENASTNLPSTVAAAAAAAQRNRPTQQQMQQMMMFQQMRMMRELIRQNNNNRAPAPPQSGGRRGRR